MALSTRGQGPTGRANRSSTASTEGLTSALPSANFTVGTVRAPPVSPAIQSPASGCASTSTSSNATPASVNRALRRAHGPHHGVVYTVSPARGGALSVTGARMPE